MARSIEPSSRFRLNNKRGVSEPVQYHGGTNFGKSASSYVTTSYYDEAPLDEYGLVRQPKWGHLKELHAAIKLISETLLWGAYSKYSLGQLQEAHVFEKNSGKCAGFLVNKDRHGAVVKFHNVKHELPRRSISILQNCNKVIFNTAKVNAQYGVRSTKTVQYFDQAGAWAAFKDEIPKLSSVSFTAQKLLEQLTTTKDVTDYLWYTISYHSKSFEEQQVLKVNSLAHIVHAFVNDVLVGTVHGNPGKPKNIVLEAPVSLKNGQNNISLLSVMVGSPDSGPYMEKRVAGLRYVTIRDIRNRHQDLSNYLWGYQIGLIGEKIEIFTQEGSEKVEWKTIRRSINQSLVWYKTTFDAPPGTDPVALNLGNMGKGEAWVNGESIGRYWVSFKTTRGQPSQSLYHVPRSFLKQSGNLLVLFEEMGGDPLAVTLEVISVPRLCSTTSESHPPSLFSRRQRRPSVQIQCDQGRNISSIEFASYGNPAGDCQNYAVGSCHSDSSKAVAEKMCLGKKGCSIPLSASKFGGDPCPVNSKSLQVVASCN